MQDDDDVTIEASEDLLAQIREAAGLPAKPTPDADVEPESVPADPPLVAPAETATFDQFEDVTISVDDMAEIAAAIKAQKAATPVADVEPESDATIAPDVAVEKAVRFETIEPAVSDLTIQRPLSGDGSRSEFADGQEPASQGAGPNEGTPVAPAQPWASEAPASFPAASADRTDGWAPTRRDVTSAATTVAPVRREPVLPPWGTSALVALVLVAAVALFVLVRSSGGDDAPSDEPVPAVDGESDADTDGSGGSGGAGGG